MNSPWTLRLGIDPANVGITGGTISIPGITQTGGAGNTPWDAFGASIPMVGTATGTMGNNGAMTIGTALDVIYPHAYYYVPAGAVAAGVPAAAAWLYGTASSTTAVTLFNNSFDPTLGAPPTVPSSPTAFVTTGPGAFTGVTAEITVFQYSVAAGSLGANGELVAEVQGTANNSAGTKTYNQKFGATTYGGQAISTQLGYVATVYVKNAGAAAKQQGVIRGFSGSTASNSTVPVLGTSNTAGAINYVVTIQRNTATDNQIVVWFSLTQRYRA